MGSVTMHTASEERRSPRSACMNFSMADSWRVVSGGDTEGKREQNTSPDHNGEAKE